jgi:quinol monooxygenase YgiN
MLSPCVRMMIEWLVPRGQTRPITAALHSIAAETREMPRCVGCSVATDLGDRSTVRYTEEWLTEDDLREHMRSDTFSRLAILIEDATRPPRIEFTLAHETRGSDFLEEVRASTQ